MKIYNNNDTTRKLHNPNQFKSLKTNNMTLNQFKEKYKITIYEYMLSEAQVLNGYDTYLEDPHEYHINMLIQEQFN